MNRLLKPLIFLLAGIYFVVDALFIAVSRPGVNATRRRAPATG